MRKWFSSVTGMAAAPAAGTATLCQRRSTLCAPANTRYRRQKVGKMIELTASDGHKLSAYRAEPKGKPRGGLIVVQEIFGVNGHIRSVADGYAADGYLAVAPAFFDRVGRGLDIGYTQPDIERGRTFIPKMQWDKVIQDAGAARDNVKSAGKVAIVGYCWGGTVSWMSASRLAGIAAAVTYYGGGITPNSGGKPKGPGVSPLGEKGHGIPLQSGKKVFCADTPGRHFHHISRCAFQRGPSAAD